MDQSDSNIEMVRSHCKTFLKIIKNNYKEQIKSQPSWSLDYNNLVHKYKKHNDNIRKLKKIEKRISNLLSNIKEKCPKVKRKSSIKASNGKGKNKKSVKFNELVQMREIESQTGKRRWNDFKQRKDNLNRGKFTDKEVELLMNALCSYVSENNLGVEGLVKLCSSSREEMTDDMKGAWCKIAECLQRRSVQSCHNFCRRKFNPNNYNGKWTEEEEQEMMQLVNERGHTWKDIATIMNSKFEYDEDIGKKFGRTSENIKDKWKQLGGDNVQYRKKGPWTLQEAVQLLKLICVATDVQLIKKRKKLNFKYAEDNEEVKHHKRLKIREEYINVYDKSVSIEEVIPLIIKKNRCKKYIPQLNISWSALQDSLKTRSIDDIRNFWQLKLLPLLVTIERKDDWNEDDDLELLNLILEMDVDDEEDIDFEDITNLNKRDEEQNKRRWTILLKGLGGVQPGKRYKVSEMAAKMIGDIETKHERYVPCTSSRSLSRNGTNQYINIVEYYKKNFQ